MMPPIGAWPPLPLTPEQERFWAWIHQHGLLGAAPAELPGLFAAFLDFDRLRVQMIDVEAQNTALHAQVDEQQAMFALSRLRRQKGTKLPFAQLSMRSRRLVLKPLREGLHNYFRDAVEPEYGLHLHSVVLDTSIEGERQDVPCVLRYDQTHPEGQLMSRAQCQKLFSAPLTPAQRTREANVYTRATQGASVHMLERIRRATKRVPTLTELNVARRAARRCVPIESTYHRSRPYAVRDPKLVINMLQQCDVVAAFSVHDQTECYLLQQDGGRLSRRRYFPTGHADGFVALCIKGVLTHDHLGWPRERRAHELPPGYSDNSEQLHPLVICYGPEQEDALRVPFKTTVERLLALKREGRAVRVEHVLQQHRVQFYGSQDFVFDTLDSGLDVNLLKSEHRCSRCPCSRHDINNRAHFARLVISRQSFDPAHPEAWIGQGRERQPLSIAQVVDIWNNIPDLLHMTGRAIITIVVIPLQQRAVDNETTVREALELVPGVTKLKLNDEWTHAKEAAALDHLQVQELRLVLAHIDIAAAYRPAMNNMMDRTRTARLEVVTLFLAELLHALHVDEMDAHYLTPPAFAAKCDLIESLWLVIYTQLDLTPTLHLMLHHLVQYMLIHGTIFQFQTQAMEHLVGDVREEERRHVGLNLQRNGTRPVQVMRAFNSHLYAQVEHLDDELQPRPYTHVQRPQAQEHHWIPRPEALLSADGRKLLQQYRGWEEQLIAVAQAVYDDATIEPVQAAAAAAVQRRLRAPVHDPEVICQRTGVLAVAMATAISAKRDEFHETPL